MAAMTTPRTAKRAAAALTRHVPIRTRYSGTKPDRPGSAMEARPAVSHSPARTGATRCIPAYSRMSWVPPRRDSHPDNQNIAAMDTPWATM